jgi:Helix-turn-helix domain
MAENGQYLTINQAADQLGVDRRRIRALIAEGKLETVDNPLDKRAKLVRRSAIEQLELYPRPPKKAAA